MCSRRIRLLVAPLIGCAGLLAFALPASASGESVGACMAHALEHESHGHLDEHLLHDEAVQDKLEKCFSAPNPILPELNEIIWGGAAFLILLVLMVKKGFPAVQAAMEARSKRIADDLDDADKAKQEAELLKANYEERLDDAKEEAAQLIDAARLDADRVRSDLITRAEADAAGMRERANAEVEAAKSQAISDLRSEVAGIALGAAERVIQANLDPEVQSHLIDAYIDEVASANG